MRKMQRLFLFAVLALSFACQKVDKGKGSGSGGSAGAAPAGDSIESKDILARTKTAPEVQVKHVLFGWKDLAAAYRGQMDPRAANRTQAEADKLARDIAAKLKAKPADIDALVKQFSEDPGSQSGEPYTVKADTAFVPEFKNLALRLEVNEVGIVKTNYGYHVMMRVTPPPPPPPDPLESADILARPPPPDGETSHVLHIMLTFKGTKRATPEARTKEEADKLA